MPVRIEKTKFPGTESVGVRYAEFIQRLSHRREVGHIRGSSTVRDIANRRAVLAACATTTACVFPVFLAGGLAVQMEQELGFTPAGLGVAVSAYFAVSALASVPVGRLVERYGPTTTARTGIVLAA